jgi:hypothetical protein
MDERIIGYEFNGIHFTRNDGRLKSGFGVSFLSSGDVTILFELIRRKTINKLESSEKTDIDISYIKLEQGISRIRKILWDSEKEHKIIETIKDTEQKGYRFIANAEPIYDHPPLPVRRKLNEGLTTFGAWLNGPGKTIKWILLAGVALTWVVTLPFAGPDSWAKPASAIMQLVMISIALGYAMWKYGPKDIPSSGDQIIDNQVKDALEKITKYWFGLLGSWLPLYLFLSLKFAVEFFYSNDLSGSTTVGYTVPANIFATICNYLNTIMIVLCFTILNERGDDEDKNLKGKYLILPAGLGIITIGIYLVLPSTTRLPVGIISNALDLITGIVAGVAMALFVGRLQSKFLGARALLLIFLYSYTAIQPLYFYLTINNSDDFWVVFLIDLYLFLKCLLFLYMAWIFDSTRIAFYLVQIRKKHKNIKTDWEKWLIDLAAADQK